METRERERERKGKISSKLQMLFTHKKATLTTHHKYLEGRAGRRLTASSACRGVTQARSAPVGLSSQESERDKTCRDSLGEAFNFNERREERKKKTVQRDVRRAMSLYFNEYDRTSFFSFFLCQLWVQRNCLQTTKGLSS